MQRLNEESSDPVKNETPWWLKYGGRGAGCVAGMSIIYTIIKCLVSHILVALVLGILNCVTLHAVCIAAGIWQMLAAFVLLILEAPCLLIFLDFVQNFSSWMDARPYWNKALLYFLISIPAVILCSSLSVIFGSGLIFATGVIYGIMALGKKASRNEMLATAASTSWLKTSQKSSLVDDPDVWRTT